MAIAKSASAALSSMVVLTVRDVFDEPLLTAISAPEIEPLSISTAVASQMQAEMSDENPLEGHCVARAAERDEQRDACDRHRRRGPEASA